MLDIAKLLEFLGILSTSELRMKYVGRSVYFMAFNTQVAFSCCSPDSAVPLTPLVVQLVFDKRVKDVRQPGLLLRSARITCSSETKLDALSIRSKLSLEADGFDLVCKLKPSSHGAAMSPCTGRFYTNMVIVSIRETWPPRAGADNTSNVTRVKDA